MANDPTQPGSPLNPVDPDSVQQPEPSPEASPEPEPLTPPDPADAERAEQLMRQVVLADRRGDYPLSDRLFAEAEGIAPTQRDVLCYKSERLIKKGQGKAAIALLKQSVALYPQDKQLENLFAETVFKTERLGSILFASSDLELMSNAKVAPWLSFFLPGLGQYVLGERSLGIGIFVVWLTSVIALFAIPKGVAGLMQIMGMYRGPNAAFQPVILLPMFLAFAAFLVAITDAGARAKRVTKVKIDFPTPPDRGGYEL